MVHLCRLNVANTMKGILTLAVKCLKIRSVSRVIVYPIINNTSVGLYLYFWQCLVMFMKSMDCFVLPAYLPSFFRCTYSIAVNVGMSLWSSWLVGFSSFAFTVGCFMSEVAIIVEHMHSAVEGYQIWDPSGPQRPLSAA
jgi:hypothetical protein